MRASDKDWGLRGAFRETLWEPFLQAVADYRLLEPGDRVAVCVSGGKDSMLLARLMLDWQPLSPVPFELVCLIMDPGYSAENRAKVEANARLLSIPYMLMDSDIFRVIEGERNPCFLCARMRRGWLYKHAQALGCNKIALGHHLDDAVETTLIAMLYGAQLQGMAPRIAAEHYPGMSLIRPLYRVHEEDILAWQRAMGLSFIRCACPFTEARETRNGVSKRQEVKELLARLSRDDPGLRDRLFESLHRLEPESLPSLSREGLSSN